MDSRAIFVFFAILACWIIASTSSCTTTSTRSSAVEAVVTIHLPFADGFTTRCTQGPGGSTSHRFRSTAFDADFDTPNDADIPVFAPIGGTAYVHDAERRYGFGVHINIDLGDGTYIILAHLDSAVIAYGEEVAAGQFLGYEGTTGASSGDHLHIGRHRGNAMLDGSSGTSITGLRFDLGATTLAIEDLVCGLTSGRIYTSSLDVPRSHPSGTLLLTPESPTVYLVDGDTLHPFLTEAAFTSRAYDFADVVPTTWDELGCFTMSPGLTGASTVRAVNGTGADSGVWILVGNATETDRYRLRAPARGWQGVLATWGITARSTSDLPVLARSSLRAYPNAGSATYRDGSLVSTMSGSAIYAMSEGVAMPIASWEDFLLLGFRDREVTEVADDELPAIATIRGDCATGTACLNHAVITTCGGAYASATE